MQKIALPDLSQAAARQRLPRRQGSQSGFTLTELMISVGLGLSVIGSVLIGYLATYTSALHTLAAGKLNQDLSTLMQVMVSELRRAGYSGAASANPAGNPFDLPDSTALTVFDSMASNKRQGPTGSGSCITYAGDANADGVVDAAELAGFRLTANGVVQMRTSGNTANPRTCATSFNSWTELTDPAFIHVDTLTFSLVHSTCLNTREPDGVDNDADAAVDEAAEADCYARVPTGGSGDVTVETREVTITLSASLAHDRFTRLTQTQNVRVRNDLVSVR